METLSGLREAIERLEGQRQESIAGELRALLGSLEQSLVRSLADMGKQFHEALSGAAQAEFGNVQGTLEGTAAMLRGMNEQFASLQASLSRVIENAERTTSGQLESGREQVEALTRLMNGLMTQMQESANQNVHNIGSQLTRVVDDLTHKVGALSEEMVGAVGRAAEASQDSARAVVAEAGAWSETTARRLEALVSSMQARSDEFQKAGQTLLSAHEALRGTIASNDAALSRMAEASRSVEMYTNALAGQGKGVQEAQTQLAKLAAHAVEATANLRAAFERHEALLGQYRKVFADYEGIFDSLDQNLGSILGKIQDGLSGYCRSIEHNFDKIVSTANNKVPDMANHLSAAVAELESQLEQLTNVFDRGLDRLNGAPK